MRKGRFPITIWGHLFYRRSSTAIKFTNVRMRNVRKQFLCQDVFCGDGGRLRASLQGISETKKFRLRIRCKDRRGATHFAQTISPPVLTSAAAASSFPNPLSKAPVAILHPRRIFPEMDLFSGVFKTEASEYIASRSTARPEDFRNGKPTSRAKLHFTALFRAVTLPSGNAQEAERVV